MPLPNEGARLNLELALQVGGGIGLLSRCVHVLLLVWTCCFSPVNVFFFFLLENQRKETKFPAKMLRCAVPFSVLVNRFKSGGPFW